MQAPSTSRLGTQQQEAARGIAIRLAQEGYRAWLVGGAVRDLCRGVVPKEIDMVSAAEPGEVERLFERTVPVGKSFGIVLVAWQGVEIDLATFRRDRGYSDSRRPDEVIYTDSVQEDAARRDFTCNALYLDPLNEELLDLVGGRADLEAGILRTVGEASRRFREDGLRLLRMARFEGALSLAPAPGLHAAARAARESLAGVSAERVLEELTRVLEGPGSRVALAAMEECGLLQRALPGWYPRAAGERPWEEVQEQRVRVLADLPEPPGAALGLAALLEVGPLDEALDDPTEGGLELAQGLRASRALRARLGALWRLRRALPDLAREGARRSARIRALRQEAAPDALRLARAWARAAGDTADGGAESALAALEAWRQGLSADDLRPEPWITPADLEAARVPRGPRWGRLLEEAEDAQLEGQVASRPEALRWLRERVAED